MKVKIIFSLILVSTHVKVLSLGNNIYMAKITGIKQFLHGLIIEINTINNAFFAINFAKKKNIYKNIINFLK
jgi:hypothetical protein